jgi:hypothetical protein
VTGGMERTMRLPAAPQRVENGILEICMEGHKKLGSLTTKFSKLLLKNQFAATIGGYHFWVGVTWAVPGFSKRVLGSVERFNNSGCPS